MEKVLINIDSRQRDYTLFPDSCFFKLEYNVNENNLTGNTRFINNNYVNFKNVDYIKLASAEIPNSYYVFSSSRDSITFKIKPIYIGPGVNPNHYPTNETTITIYEGNYDSEDLVNNLNKSLNVFSFNEGYLNQKKVFIVTEGLKFSVDINTSIITLAHVTTVPPAIPNRSVDYNFELNFENKKEYISLGYIIGFRNNKYTLPSLGNISGEAVSDPNGENYIFIRINDYGNIYINPKLPVRVLTKIVLDQMKENFIFNNGQDLINKTHKFRQPTDVKSLEIELLDYTGRRLNNNGLDFSITLELGFIYDEKLYLENLNSLELSKRINKTQDIILNDTNSNISSINNKTTTEILDDVFHVKPEIVQVAEIKHIEEKRKSHKKKKKKEFGFDY